MAYEYRMENPDAGRAAEAEKEKEEQRKNEEKKWSEDQENAMAPPVQQTGAPGAEGRASA
jgi:hypothetical protein